MTQDKIRPAFELSAVEDGLSLIKLPSGRYASYLTQAAWRSWQACAAQYEAKPQKALEVAREALEWSRVFIKFHVKPERCVEINDNVKSALQIYEMQIKALTTINSLLGEKE